MLVGDHYVQEYCNLGYPSHLMLFYNGWLSVVNVPSLTRDSHAFRPIPGQRRHHCQHARTDLMSQPWRMIYFWSSQPSGFSMPITSNHLFVPGAN